MDLFGLVSMEVPTSVTVGVRPRGDDEPPVLEAANGRLVELNILEPSGSVAPAAVEPIQQVPHVEAVAAHPPSPPVVNVDDSEEETEEERLERRRKRARSEEVEGPVKKPSLEDEAGPSSPTVEKR